MSSSARGGARTGMFVAAIWLIGIGAVFLVQQGMGWTWGEAWPLWIILVGAGSLGSMLLGPPRSPAGFFAALGWPLLIVAIGVVLLLSTTGSLDTGPGELVATWWPVALVVLGGWLLIAAVLPSGTRTAEQLAVPLGAASEANVRLRFGGGELNVGASQPGLLVSGEFRGGVRHSSPGIGQVRLDAPAGSAFPWFDDWPRWTMGVTSEVPLDLDVEGGAARTRLDLGGHRLRELRIKTGASETRVALPSAAGQTHVRAEAGAAALIFEVPTGVAVRLRSRMALGNTSVDPRIPREGDLWRSPDYETAANRVDLDVSGGIGSLRVTVTGS